MLLRLPSSAPVSTGLPYFEYAIETVFNGGTIDQDWCKGIADGSVVMTTLNEKICAKGTAEKVAEVEKALKDGTSAGL